jgi:hypothetical protein
MITELAVPSDAYRIIYVCKLGGGRGDIIEVVNVHTGGGRRDIIETKIPRIPEGGVMPVAQPSSLVPSLIHYHRSLG